MVVDIHTAVQVADGVRSIVAGVPGLKEAAHEVVSYYVTDPLKFARRVRNLEQEREFAEEMIKGHSLIDNPSTKDAERILKAASEEDRELLQKMWAALIARLVTGQLPTIRSEWIEIIKGLEPIDAGILEILPNLRLTGKFMDDNAFLRILEEEFTRKFPQYSVKKEDFLLSLSQMQKTGLLGKTIGYPRNQDGTWKPAWVLSMIGNKILEITSPPIVD